MHERAFNANALEYRYMRHAFQEAEAVLRPQMIMRKKRPDKSQKEICPQRSQRDADEVREAKADGRLRRVRSRGAQCQRGA